MMDHGALPPGVKLRQVLGEARYLRVTSAATSLGVPAAGLDAQAPWMVGIELTEAAYTHEGFDPEAGVEEQLVRRAQADGKATAGLETLPEELGGLIALSREDQVRMLDETVDELKDIKSEMADIVTAWRAVTRCTPDCCRANTRPPRRSPAARPQAQSALAAARSSAAERRRTAWSSWARCTVGEGGL
jgi:uncharacterized protein YbaP (TraB family)